MAPAPVPRPMAGRLLHRLHPWILLAAPLLLLTVFFAYPLAEVLRHAFDGLDAWQWLRSDFVRDRLAVAFEQALWSVALTFALALPLAWLHHRRHVPGRRWHLAVHAAPFVLPVFVVIYGIQGVFGNNGWIATWTGIDVLARVGPLGAVVLAHAYYNYGFTARLLVTVLDRRPRRLEEAALVLGAHPGRAFGRVSLPLLLPAMLSIAVLVFLFSFTSFGVVLFLGAGEVATLETLLYGQLGGAFPRYDRAAVLGVLQLGINVVTVLAYLWLLQRERRVAGRAEGHRMPARRGHVAVAWVALAAGVLPALTVLVDGFRVGPEWSLEPWRALLHHTHPKHVAGFSLARATGLSLLYAAATVVLSLSLTLLLAYGLRQLRALPRRLIETFGAIPLGTSSLLIGLGYLLAFGAGDLLDLRGSTAVIVLAHTLVAFPFVARVLLPAMDLRDVRQEEAAALLGAGPLQVARRIHLPQLRPAILVAAGLSAAMSLGDFGASLLLMRPDNMSIAVWIARHDRPFDPLYRAQAVALAGVLMLLATFAYLVVERFRTGREAIT